ncbi:MAG TPA: dipeptidase [Woeseiaceae bacterium]|nr:dipeptidase [Woeseiaceae bacterium]
MSAKKSFARSISFLTAFLCAALLTACGPSADTSEPQAAAQPQAQEASIEASARATELAKNSIIVDTHIDVPYRLDEEWANVSEATDGGDFDYPRAVAGGLNAPFMSIYTPAELQTEGGAKDLAEKLIDMVNEIAAQSPEKFAVAYSPLDIERQFNEGLISLPMGMENGAPLEDDIANVGHFYDRGIRYVTLAHSLSNLISDSSYDDNKQWGGLSEFGVDVVREMNRLGIMVDVSHISDDAFWDVMEVTRAPVIASHSSARHFTPGWERNMADDMIVRLAENGGLVMINFGSDFLSKEAFDYSAARRDAFMKYFEANELDAEDEEARRRFREEYEAEHGPYPYATLEQTLDHFDHVVELTSVDHVGIGSDYDGVGDSLPVGLKDVSSYPNLIEGLLRRGYSEEDVRKILGENLLRVWREVEDVARSL